MKKVLLSLLAAILAILVCCGIAWLGGYNFDSRGFWVAAGAFYLIAFGAMVFQLTMAFLEE